jgi:hypothetical protein
MPNVNRKLLFPVLMVCLSTALSHGTVDSTAAKASFQFLDESLSPRQIAMGNAGTAMPGAGFCTYNPAQPFLSSDPSLTIGYSPMPGDLTAVVAEGFFNHADMFYGMHLSNYSIRDIIPSTVQGINENAAFSSGFSLVSLVAGIRRERYGLAVTVSGMQDRIGVSTAYGLSVGAGAACTAVPGKLTLGLGLLNEGTSTGYTDDTKDWGDGDRMPRSARLGAAYADTLGGVPVTAALDVVYRDVGDKLRDVKGVAPRMTVPLGVEVWPTDYVTLRLGKRINFDTEVMAFGAGFRFRPLSFDMSFVISKLYEDVEVKPAFGLTYTPVAKPKQKTVITAPAAEVKPLAPPQEQPKIEEKPQAPQDEAKPQEESQPQAPQPSPPPKSEPPSPESPAKVEPAPQQPPPSMDPAPQGDAQPPAPKTMPGPASPGMPGMR